MAGYKGVGVVFIRRLARERGAAVEQQIVDALNDDDRRTYQACTATAWVPIEFVVRLALTAAPLLFPKDPAPLDRLGRALALDNMGGIYAYLVRVLTVEFIARQSAGLWRVYHDEGEARTETLGPRAVRFAIRGYQQMPADFRRYMRAFVAQLIEMTGARGVEVVPDDDDDSWGYRITWSAR